MTQTFLLLLRKKGKLAIVVNVTLPKRSSYAIGLKRLYLLFYLFNYTYRNHLPCPFRLNCDLTVGSFDHWSSFFVLIQLWNQKKWFLWFLLFGRISKWYFRQYIFANHTLILWQLHLKNSLKIKYQATFFLLSFWRIWPSCNDFRPYYFLESGYSSVFMCKRLRSRSSQ